MEIPYIVNQLREEEKLGILSCKGLQELKKLKTDYNQNDHLQDNCILFVEDEESYDDIPDKDKDKIILKEPEEKTVKNRTIKFMIF